MLKIKNCSKSIQNFEILKECNLELDSGKIMGLVGVNGAGKTTLLKCIAGIYDFEGSITLNDEIIYENEKVKSKVMYVQDSNIFPRDATIKSMVDLYNEFYDFNESLFRNYIHQFNLDENKKISSFSKGMQRLTALCLAFAAGPELLLLDEAFDGLDPKSRLQIKRILINELDESNMSVLISSHALRELEDICDDFAILDKHILSKGNVTDSIGNLNRVQVVYDKEIDVLNSLSDFEVVDYKQTGNVHVIVVRGNIEDIEVKLNENNPVFLEKLNVSFEELFIFSNKEVE